MVVTYCGSCACRTIEPPCTCECHATELDRLRAALAKAEAERDALQARVNAYLNALDALNDFDHGEDSDLRTRSELVFRLSDREDALRAGKEGKR